VTWVIVILIGLLVLGFFAILIIGNLLYSMVTCAEACGWGPGGRRQREE
jgi:uncharacterized SAM-binding protein YcdF (DUF218 family)